MVLLHPDLGFPLAPAGSVNTLRFRRLDPDQGEPSLAFEQLTHHKCINCPLMRLNAFSDYSLRVLLLLAMQPEHRLTVADLAARLHVRRNHLTKVAHFLAREGWVQANRGKGGGLQLGRPAAEILIGSVVRRAEGADRPAECFEPGGGRCPIAPGCRLSFVLAEAMGAFHAVLDRWTLADLVARPEHMVSLRTVLGLRGPSETRVS